jgi:hypothetical protein
MNMLLNTYYTLLLSCRFIKLEHLLYEGKKIYPKRSLKRLVKSSKAYLKYLSVSGVERYDQALYAVIHNCLNFLLNYEYLLRQVGKEEIQILPRQNY